MEIVGASIIRHDEQGFIVHVPYDNLDRALLRQYKDVVVGLPDGRTISPEQRKKAHAIIGEIADWGGFLPEYVKRLLKIDFVTNRLQALEKSLFSLSDCDMTLAREFITFLIDFAIEHGVPTKEPLYELCEDIERYVYSCLMHKRCAVCGRERADMYHFDQIGMGRDRTRINQLGMLVISLCRECHDKAHTKGRSWLTDDLHLNPIPLTYEIGRKYGIKKKQLEG